MRVATRRLLVRLSLSLVVAGGFVWWIGNQGIDIIPSAAAFAGVSAWAIPLYVLTLAAVHFLRAYRWIYLLRPVADVPVARMLPVAFVGFLAILVLPLRMGELARPYLIKRHAGVSMSAALGTIAIERVIDGLLVSFWLTLCLFGVSPEAGPYVWPLRVIPLGLFVGALAALIALLVKGEAAAALAESLCGRVSARLAATAGHVLRGFSRGLSALPDRGALARFVGMSVAYWSINAAGVLLLARGCGLPLEPLGAVATMAIAAVGILLPSGPGFFGNFQAGVLVALGLYLPLGAIGDRVSVFIFVLYLCQVAFTLLVGLGSAAAGRLSLRDLATPDLSRVAADDCSEWT